MENLARYLIALCAVAFSLLPSNSVYANDEWYKCKTVNECTVLKGNCGVEWAINKKFSEIPREKLPRNNSDCNKPLENHPSDTFVICADSRCILYPPGTYAGGKSIDLESCLIASCWGHLGCNYLTCTRSDGSKYTKYAQ